MKIFKLFIPKFLVKFIRPYYHGLVALFAHVYFGKPSEKLVVIGVTGTNGKSTTVNLLSKILSEAGKKCGFSSTVTWDVGNGIVLNQEKISMPSGWVLHKRMNEMFKNGCQYAVIEVSSEGLAQNRHLGINFDTAVFTNLTPEHIEAHGSFENYKKAKAKLFAKLKECKVTSGKLKVESGLQKTIITNADDENSKYYGSFKADNYVIYGVKNDADFQAVSISYSPFGINFTLSTLHFQLKLKGQFDVYNSLAAIATAASHGVFLETSRQALEKVEVVPGRVEVVRQEPFVVVVDYAYEPEEMRQLYETVQRWPKQKIIQVLGPCGGGRDRARIKILGEMAAKFADFMIVTTDDPYDDDPKELIHEMADAAVAKGKVIGQTLFRNPDRRGAMVKAFTLAKPGDLVLITGKGADQKMALANGLYIDWDDRKVAREELMKILNDKNDTSDKN